MRVSVIVFLCLLAVHSDQRSTPQDATYVAAVVEYQVNTDVTANVQNYVQLTREAAEKNADIVVFPEMTLTRGTRAVTVPVYGILKESPIPALHPDLYDEILVNISAAARQHEVYVVINVQESVDCSDRTSSAGEECPEEKLYLFNTNVVFDRTGAIIDRYRKINLFGEFTRTPALKPDLGIFSTDFGVTFGHYICFDLMFQVPAVQLVQKHNLTDVIFTTMWFSEMPYLTAVQIQESYAYAMNVNFLASGANNVGVGSAGSGIYSGKAGALVSTMPGKPTTRLLISTVPKVPGEVNFDVDGPIYDDPSDHDSLVLISDPSLPAHSSRALVPGFQEFTLVDKEVSCKFTVRLSQRDGEAAHYYRAYVKDGINMYSRRQVGVAVCSVVACATSGPESCARRFNKEDSTVQFQELEISMITHRHQYNNSLKCDNVVYFPSSMRNSKFPLDPVNFTYTDSTQNGGRFQNDMPWLNRGRDLLTYKINAPQNDLVSFAIWGRLYNRDVDHKKEITEQDVQNYLELENGIYFQKEFKKKDM